MRTSIPIPARILRSLALVSLAVLLAAPPAFAQEKPRFIRGDANVDQDVNISDAIFILLEMYSTGDPLRCREGADTNADRKIDLSDPIYLLQFLFLTAPPPPRPFPDCDEPDADLAFDCQETPCPPASACPIRAHGCVGAGVECPMFRADDGSTYEILGQKLPMGWCGTIAAKPRPDMASVCMQGEIVEVCSAVPDEPGDCPLLFHGKAVRGVECVVFLADGGKTYELIGGPPEVRVPGWSGTIRAKPRSDMFSFCMQGQIVEICSAVPD